MEPIGIIGSGHTGIATAKALVARGFRPVIFDVGEKLDPERMDVVSRLGRQDRAEWAKTDLETLTQNPTVFGDRPKRLAFGSDFIYAGSRDAAPLTTVKDGPSPTFARGGFSNVWGAAMLPADDCDIADWPFGRDSLAPHYAEVLKDFPLSADAEGDRLSRRFPLYHSSPKPIRLAPQLQVFLERLRLCHSLKDRDDVLFGQARLAVRAADDQYGAGCKYCGYCLSGCVYDANSYRRTRFEILGTQQES